MTDAEWLRQLKPLKEPPRPLQDAVMEYVLRALKFYGWAMGDTAKALGISRRGLQNRLNAYRARGVYIPPYASWESREHKKIAAKLDGLLIEE